MKRSQTPGSRTARVEDLDVDGDVEQRGRQDADHRAHHGAVAAVQDAEDGQPVRRRRVRDDLQDVRREGRLGRVPGARGTRRLRGRTYGWSHSSICGVTLLDESLGCA